MRIVLVALLACIVQVKGDTPADCRYEDIRGTWEFRETSRDHDNTLNCDEMGQVEYTNRFTLEYPNIVKDEHGNIGNWTLVYNQGFEVNINQRSYFAFSLYEETFYYFESYCDKTFPGWSHDVTGKNWACYEAQKLEAVKPRVTHKPYLNGEIKFVNDHKLINMINSKQSSWSAKSYPQFEKYTLREMIRRSGGFNSANFQNRVSAVEATAEQKRAASKLPKNFDWRDVDGRNFVSPVRDQRSCGSCYAFASMGALEARVRVATNNRRQDVFSPQDILDCSVLSQGCNGGFNYLIAGRYAEDYGVIPEKCNKYLGHEKHPVEKEEVCKNRDSCEKTFVSEYGYIGGYYGNCSEEAMMVSLHENGPLPVSFMVYDDFRYYSGGVYKHETFGLKYDPLVPTSHAVLLVGYGVDERTGEKYWTCKNSWGDDWGQEGYFKILRGTDECGIESAGFEFDVKA